MYMFPIDHKIFYLEIGLLILWHNKFLIFQIPCVLIQKQYPIQEPKEQAKPSFYNEDQSLNSPGGLGTRIIS